MTVGLLKTLALILTLSLFASAALGCGKGEDSISDVAEVDNNQQERKDEAPQDDTGNQEPQEESVIDLGGREFRYGAWWDLEPKEGTSEHSDKLIARIAEMEEKYNFKMKYLNIPWEQLHEQFAASIMAGDPILDIAIVEDKFFFPGYVTRGFLYPVSDLKAFDFSEDKWNKDYMEFCTYEGKVYGFSEYRTDPRSNIFWNKTLFEREGLPNLYEIHMTDEWTWDKMLEIARKATKDLDGDGTIDQWGLGGMGTEWGIVYSNGGEVIKFVDNKPVFGLNDPRAIEALQFYQDLIHVHRVYELPPDGAAWDYPSQQFQDGKYAMFHGYWWQAPTNFQTSMQDDYGFVLFPKGPSAGDDYASPLSGINFAVMPINVKDPEAVAVIWDEYTDPFPGDDPDAWKEGYANGFRDLESVATVEYMQKSGIFKHNKIRCFSELEELSWSFMWQINTANKTAKVAIEEIAEQAQSLIDDTMAQAKMSLGQ